MTRLLSRRSVIGLLTCPAALTVTSALSLQEGPVDWTALLRKSGRILIARCERLEVRVVAEYGGNPFTFYDFTPVEVLKGSVGQSLQLRVFGGRIGNTTVSAEDTPEFVVDRTYLMFLGDNNADGFPLMLTGGLFEVVEDSRRGTRMAVELGGPPGVGRDLGQMVERIRAGLLAAKQRSSD